MNARYTPEFLSWLKKCSYARDTPKGPVSNLSAGVVLYMWEAFDAGRTHGMTEPAGILLQVASVLERREQLRSASGDPRMVGSTASDVSAAIRTVTGAASQNPTNKLSS